MNKDVIRVLLVDDHVVLRDGLAVLLSNEEDIQVIGEAGNVQDAIRLAEENMPDVVVMDLGLPGGGGLKAIKEIREKNIQVRIVVLSMHSNKELVMQVMEAGSDGYVPKSSAHENLLDAIRVVYSGERFLHPIAATAVVDELLEKQDQSRLLENLSDRETQVLRLTAMGFSSREIGEKLSLSPKTIETYRQRVMDKMDFKHRSELVKFALKAGLLVE
ncbi:response regulator [Chloroflexota bacterium]